MITCTDGGFYLPTVEIASRFLIHLVLGKKQGENRKPEHTSNTFNNFVVFPCYKEMESQEFLEVHRGNPKNIVYKNFEVFHSFSSRKFNRSKMGGRGDLKHTQKSLVSR